MIKKRETQKTTCRRNGKASVNGIQVSSTKFEKSWCFFLIILLEIKLSLNCCQNKYENSHNIAHKFHHYFCNIQFFNFKYIICIGKT